MQSQKAVTAYFTSQKAVTAYFTSKQLLPFDFVYVDVYLQPIKDRVGRPREKFS